jgi:amidase
MAASENDFCYLSVGELGRRFRAGVLTSKDLTSCFLNNIDKSDGHLHAYARVLRDSAEDEADRADRELAAGLDRGPLHGIPIAVKDLIDSMGITTAAGMMIHGDHLATEDGTVLRRLRAAGAVILGKLTLTEAATLEHHPAIAAPLNPWNAGYNSGFSSSGAGVAVAAGLCAAALGSDTGGSIRIPASFNGVTGVKPTWGRVSRHGVFPLVEYFDTIGPMARSAAGAAAVLEAIAGADPRDPTADHAPVPRYLAAIAEGISGISIGVDFDRIDSECDPAVSDALRAVAAILSERGAQIRPIALPAPDCAQFMTLSLAGFMDAHRATFPARADDYGPQLRATLEAGLGLAGRDVAAAINVVNAWKAQLRALFDQVDLILAPATTHPAPVVGAIEAAMHNDPAVLLSFMAYTLPFNASGSPAVTFPSGFSRGLPIGTQIIGPHFSEGLLLRAAHAFQSRTDWHLHQPAVAGATASAG